MYAGALFITKSTGFEGDGPIYVSILILLAIAALFTVAGGLAAVIWTDFIQTVLMIIGAIALAALGTLTLSLSCPYLGMLYLIIPPPQAQQQGLVIF